jgi:hypothetical protein
MLITSSTMLRVCTRAVFVAFLVAIMGMDGRVIAGATMDGTQPPITANLSVRTDNGAIFARLVYKNRSGEDAFIDRRNACLDGRIENDVFRIAMRGKGIEYRGALAKRRAPSEADFLKLTPGQSVTTEVRLDGDYAFLKGKHTYTVSYSAYQQFPGQRLWELKSNSIRFVATR